MMSSVRCRRCTRFLGGHGPQDAAQLLGTIPADTDLDRYGEGAVVATLEAGCPRCSASRPRCSSQRDDGSAVGLRVHADGAGSRTVGFHPACHLDQHEGRGYERLHGLRPPIGDPDRLLTAGDLERLPNRWLPCCSSFRSATSVAAAPGLPAGAGGLGARAGAAVHMDGARLWESAAIRQSRRRRSRRCSTPSTSRSIRGSARCPGAPLAGSGRDHRRGPGMAAGWAAPCSACGRTRRPR